MDLEWANTEGDDEDLSDNELPIAQANENQGLVPEV